jgi:hypothetical protein
VYWTEVWLSERVVAVNMKIGDVVGRFWRVPRTQAQRLKIAAAREGRTAESIVVEAIERSLRDYEAAYEADVRTFVGGDR